MSNKKLPQLNAQIQKSLTKNYLQNSEIKTPSKMKIRSKSQQTFKKSILKKTTNFSNL